MRNCQCSQCPQSSLRIPWGQNCFCNNMKMWLTFSHCVRFGWMVSKELWGQVLVPSRGSWQGSPVLDTRHSSSPDVCSFTTNMPISLVLGGAIKMSFIKSWPLSTCVMKREVCIKSFCSIPKCAGSVEGKYFCSCLHSKLN